MQLSIVTTLYKSAPYIEEFWKRVTASAAGITDDYEIIFVNDGSPDDSLNVALKVHERDPKVKVIDLSRNFGHHKAMMTGLSGAKGELVFLIDVDLEEEPEWLPLFHKTLQETKGCDVVYGVQDKRKGGLIERAGGAVFYWLYDLLSTTPIPANCVTARLMRAPYVRALTEHQDREMFMAGLWALTGFRQTPLSVQKGNRPGTSYSFGHRMAVLVNAITSFSNRPLIAIFYLGSFVFLIGLAGALYLIIRRVFYQEYLSGWPSLIVSIWLLGGLNIFCVGILGIYLAKIFTEVKRRPLTVIRQVYEKNGGAR